MLKSVLNIEEEKNEGNGFENFDNVRNQVALEFIRRFGDYPFDLFKIRMSTIIEDLIEIDIFEFAKYLESRCKAPDVLTQIQMAKVKKNTVSVMTLDNLWCLDEQLIRKTIEYKTEELKRVQMLVLDVASIHLSRNNDKRGRRFNINLIYEKLADTDND